MKKIKEFISKNKKIIIVSSGIIVAVIAFIVGFMLLGGNNQEKELTELLKEMGRDFYENYYYDGLKKQNKTEEEIIEFLKKYEKQGIKININNLSRFNTSVNEEKISKFINKKTNEPCDADSSQVIIYPTSDYKKEDYRIEAILVCGFKEEKKDKE